MVYFVLLKKMGLVLPCEAAASITKLYHLDSTWTPPGVQMKYITSSLEVFKK